MGKIRSEKESHSITSIWANGKTRRFKDNCLYTAVGRNPAEMTVIKDLLANGYNITKKYYCGNSILHIAVLKRRPEVEVIKLLLNYGADVNMVDDKGDTPLHSAVRFWTGSPSCQYEVVKVLLDAGVDVNALNITQRTAFNLAVNAAKLNFNVIRELLRRGADTKLKMGTALCCVLSNRSMKIDTVKLLMEYGERPGTEELEIALNNPNCSCEIIEEIVSQSSVDLNSENPSGFTSLHEAVTSGCKSCLVEVLLEMGADPNIESKVFYGLTPLHMAVQFMKCPPDVIGVLLQNGANPGAVNEYEMTPLMYAAMHHSDVIFIEVFLKNGVNPNEMKASLSAMHFAAINKFGNTDVLKILIKNRGNVNVADRSSRITPLLYALNKKYNIVLIKELIRNGATLSAPNKFLSPLLTLIENKFYSKDTVPVIQEILKCNPGLLYRDVLFDALKNRCRLDVFDELLKQGADVYHKNSLQRSPLFVALEYPTRNMHVIELLLQYDAWCTRGQLQWIRALHEVFSNSENKAFLKLLIKYATLHKYVFQNKQSDEFTFSDPRYLYLLNYQTECENESSTMFKLGILEKRNGKKISLSKLLAEKKESQIFEIYEASILKILTDNMFPIYSDVIASKLKRSVLIEHLLTRRIYARTDMPYPHDIVLPADTIRLIAGHLSKDSIVNLLAVFKSEY
ncbi:serine/threonine-protein phosphatase 6 regulatory ankyrin repeat subunit B-like [Argiope bruennichi]|uniref:serine/threonine-protein phosphatase 6 regulatory ankyrin repeat subunit B-like n=1 Tax=Argiope bruennichi TaxID=94029 RepID=UPI002493D84C|nr:serine/threonine-protein phosphatase 6 regulatory ankyrin repeat subunit B-like [Argiope bruennichi]